MNNQIIIPQDKSLLRIRGIFSLGSHTNYGGNYWDNIKDEVTDMAVTLIVPALLRNELTDNQTIDFYGYITHRVEKTGKISVQINISELISQSENKISEDDIKTFEVLQKKVKQGYRDVDSFIKKSIYEKRMLNIVIIIGKNAIVDNDIKHQLQEGISFYNIEFIRANFSSVEKIITKLEEYKEKSDIIILSRGGGEGVDIFDKPDLAQACLALKPYLLTAIGHKDDESLIDKIADKSFSTPTALGQYLNDIYNTTVEEFTESKAKIVKELEAVFKDQIAGLASQLKELNNIVQQKEKVVQEKDKIAQEKDKIIHEKTSMLEASKKVVENLEISLSKQSVMNNKNMVILWIFVGMIVGVIIMALIK